MSEYVYPQMKSSFVITYTMLDLRVVTSSRKYTPYRTIWAMIFYATVRKSYNPIYAKIVCTIVYTAGPSLSQTCYICILTRV